MSLHKINASQITKIIAGVSITREPNGYEGLRHTMKVGVWIRTDGIDRPVAWGLVDDEDVIHYVTNLAQGDWSATWDLLDGFQETVRNTWEPSEENLGVLAREMRDECTDYDVYVCAQDVRTPEDVIDDLDAATLARCYMALGARYEWWRNEDGGHALVPRLTQCQDLTPGSLRLPILVWDGKADEYAVSSIYDFIGAELEPIMEPYDEAHALESLADLIATPDYRTAWDYSAREIPEWYGHYPKWVYQTDFELV